MSVQDCLLILLHMIWKCQTKPTQVLLATSSQCLQTFIQSELWIGRVPFKMICNAWKFERKSIRRYKRVESPREAAGGFRQLLGLPPAGSQSDRFALLNIEPTITCPKELFWWKTSFMAGIHFHNKKLAEIEKSELCVVCLFISDWKAFVWALKMLLYNFLFFFIFCWKCTK